MRVESTQWIYGLIFYLCIYRVLAVACASYRKILPRLPHLVKRLALFSDGQSQSLDFRHYDSDMQWSYLREGTVIEPLKPSLAISSVWTRPGASLW